MRCKFCNHELENSEDQCPRCGGIQYIKKAPTNNPYQHREREGVSISHLFIGHILLIASSIAYLALELFPDMDLGWAIWIPVLICEIIGVYLIEKSGISFPAILTESIILLLVGGILILLPFLGIGGEILIGIGAIAVCFALVLLFFVYPR